MGKKMRYMTHYRLVDLDNDKRRTVFAGVWVQGPDMQGDLDYAYLPGFEELEDRANDIINELVEADRGVPDDILENMSNSGYFDAWGPIMETDEYDGITALEEAILKQHGPQ